MYVYCRVSGLAKLLCLERVYRNARLVVRTMKEYAPGPPQEQSMDPSKEARPVAKGGRSTLRPPLHLDLVRL